MKEEEISSIDTMLRDEFEDFLEELNLFFPKKEKTLWYLTFTNCYLYESICGSEEKSCCIRDRTSDKDIKACLDGDYTGKAMQVRPDDGDSLLYTSICVRETIPNYENFVTLNYFPNSTWSSSILNNYEKSFVMQYKSNSKHREPDIWRLVHDADLNTVAFGEYYGHPYFVEFSYSSTWTDNDGYGLVSYILSAEGPKKPSFYKEKFGLGVKGRFKNNTMFVCDLVDENFLEPLNVDYYAISFACPKISIKYFKMSLNVTAPIRIHEFHIERKNYNEFIENLYKQYDVLKKEYLKPVINENKNDIESDSTETIPLNPPIVKVVNNGSVYEENTLSDDEKLYNLENILNFNIKPSNDLNDGSWLPDGMSDDEDLIESSAINKNYYDKLIDIVSWEKLTKHGSIEIPFDQSLQNKPSKRG